MIQFSDTYVHWHIHKSRFKQQATMSSACLNANSYVSHSREKYRAHFIVKIRLALCIADDIGIVISRCNQGVLWCFLDQATAVKKAFSTLADMASRFLQSTNAEIGFFEEELQDKLHGPV